MSNNSSNGGNSMMGRLLADRYRVSSLAVPVTSDPKNYGNSQNKDLLEQKQKTLDGHSFGDLPPMERLEALCRSTLKEPECLTDKNLSTKHHTSTGDRSLSPRYYTGDGQNEICYPSNSTSKRSFPQENLTSWKPKILENSTLGDKERTRLTSSSTSDIPLKPHLRYVDERRAFLQNLSKSMVVQESNPYSVSVVKSNLSKGHRPELQLHGHPKSNSGGDEYLYTDQLRRNYQRRGIRSKKNKINVGRSSSLRYAPEESMVDFDHTPPAADVKSDISTIASSKLENNFHSEQAKHFSSKSVPLQKSTRDSCGLAEQRRSSLHVSSFDFNDNIHRRETSNDQENGIKGAITPSDFGKFSQCEMHQNQILPHSSVNGGTVYIRGGTPYGQGPVFNGNVLVKQSPVASNENGGVPGHSPMMTAAATTSPPRPPPPPYHHTYGELDTNHVQSNDVDVGLWNPQRPNSLALGNTSKKKSPIVNVTSQNSPCLTSPTSNKCFSPAVRGTPFYGKDSPFMNANASSFTVLTNSPMQRQPNIAANSYTRKSGSGNNVANLSHVTPTSSGSSTVTPTFYSESQSHSDSKLRSPAGGNRFSIQTFSQDLYGSGSSSSGINKSDSINSTSSGASGSGLSKNAKRKRNNNSKLGYGSASCSGSSSNSGSRPNSNADLAERFETENESLRNHLDAALQKLRKYESIEMELVKITNSHVALKQTASNRERLEKEMIVQLQTKLEKYEKEKEYLETQVVSLSQQLKNVELASSKDDLVDTAKENNFSVDLHQAQTRKFAERERQLQEELEECRERMKEQKSDIESLTLNLDKAQSTITVLNEQFLQTSLVDANTEELSDQLLNLQKIVNERQNIELKLMDQIKRQLDAQRPLKSTSSNDEGISEMDLPNAPSNLIDLYNSRERQMLGAKAKMLEWRHRYMEHEFLNYVLSNGADTNQQRRLYRALRNHRHAVSDPGFDKNPHIKSLVSEFGRLAMKKSPVINHSAIYNKLSDQKLNSGSGSSENPNDVICQKSISNSKLDCASQTPTSGWLIGESESVDRVMLTDTNENSPKRVTSSGNNFDGDLPSEGYHSQQSSGSPTPNQEKYALDFASTGDKVNGANQPTVKKNVSTVFRRNKSADDVLTTLKV